MHRQFKFTCVAAVGFVKTFLNFQMTINVDTWSITEISALWMLLSQHTEFDQYQIVIFHYFTQLELKNNETNN